jgi:hypothetical protein
MEKRLMTNLYIHSTFNDATMLTDEIARLNGGSSEEQGGKEVGIGSWTV